MEEKILKNNKKYYIGLDIGTNSVGWAVTNLNYEVLKFKGNAAWGVNPLPETAQASERRLHRTEKRRLDRHQQRIALLQELFAKIILPYDENFFLRLKESDLFKEDKTVNADYGIFNNPAYKDCDYHEEYPTIHHLILDLMNSDKEHDARLVYMACAYILAHRGHFLLEADKDNVSAVINVDMVYEEFEGWFDSMGVNRPFDCDKKEIADILKSGKGIKAKQTMFKNLLGNLKSLNNDEEYPIDTEELIKLLCGAKIKLAKLFKNDDYKELETADITFATEDFDTIADSLSGSISEDEMGLLLSAKPLFDWSLLSDILCGCDSISLSKVKEYEKHKSDLAKLKSVVKRYLKPEDYKKLFKTTSTKLDNYTKYSGNLKSSKTDGKLEKLTKCSQENFCKFVKGMLKNVKAEDDDELKYVLSELENNSLCPKQVTGNNRVIPYQLYYDELKKILKNASKYISGLNEADEYGTVADKILSIMTFRIPYYVGPLVSKEKSDNAWFKREADGRILPWNFDELVNKDVSEERFIRRMTAKCSYIAGEDVLPKYSLLYTKFCVLNEINNIKIDGKPIDVKTKQNIYNLFLEKRNVTRKMIEGVLRTEGLLNDEAKLEGIDTTVKSKLTPWHDFKSLLERGVLTERDVERIIMRITMTTDKMRFKSWLAANYDLSEQDIKYISKLKYNDFGRLSERVLTEVIDTDLTTGETSGKNIITMMWETNRNFMELMSSNYNFTKNIEFINREYYDLNPKTIEEQMDDMYLSSAVRRPIKATLEIVKEIKKIFGGEPEKIFVEMTRGAKEDQKNKRTTSRRDKIKEFYDSFGKDEYKELRAELESKTDEQLRGEKLYLYFMQLGRCMYSGERIELSELSSKRYDVDHIYPQSKIKDDSLSNKVLVKSELNQAKSDVIPISADIQDKMMAFWKMLLGKKLINDEKFKRLTRTTPFTDEDLAGFINRQLVETSQATKAVTIFLKQIFDNADIVYVKAANVSEFRKQCYMLKCREVNDLHHAKDAYLNIVVGNIYDVKFTRNPFIFIEELKKNNNTDGKDKDDKNQYSLKIGTLLNNNIERGGVVAWKKYETIRTVRKYMAKNNIRYVRYAFRRKGRLFEQMPYRAAEGLIPRKKGLDTAKYGGYNSAAITYYILVKYYAGKNKGLMITPVEGMFADRVEKDNDFKIKYLSDMIYKLCGKMPDRIEFPLGERIIKINTMLDIDGFRLNITGKTENRFLYESANSLLLDKKYYDYVKRLSSYQSAVQKGDNYRIDEIHDKITREDNIALYDELCRKIHMKPFVIKMATPAQQIEKGREKFISLGVDEQIKALSSIVSVMKTGRAGGCDLTLIGASKASAVMLMGMDLYKAKDAKSIRIIDQSPTGLYEVVSENLLTL